VEGVGPWNRKRRAEGGPAFAAREGLMAPDLDALAALDDDAFRERFRKSPVKRAKRRGLLRNVAVALGNSGDSARRPVLERLAADEDPVVREHAPSALGRFREAQPQKRGEPEGPPAVGGQPAISLSP